MNPFNAPDLPLTQEQVTEAILGQIRTLLLQIRKHCLACRLNGRLPSLYSRDAISAFLSALVELAAGMLPSSALSTIQCEALAVTHETRFLMRGTREAYLQLVTAQRG